MKANLVVPDIRDNYIENLLTAYGIQDLEKYLNPTFESIQNPKDFNNIKEGAEVLINSCNNKEKILLIVDCDCDGFTSAAIFYQYVKRIWPDIDIEYRLHEGKQHGVNDCMDYIKTIPEKSVDLILTDPPYNIAQYSTGNIPLPGRSAVNNDLGEWDLKEINPFDFPKKFDVIVGNPPYQKSEDMKNLTPKELAIYKKKYESAYKQFDKYIVFIERAYSLLNENGMLGYIVASKFMKLGAGQKQR